MLCVCVRVLWPQGLSQDMQERLSHIEFENPCDVLLHLPEPPMSRTDTKRAVDATLRQLNDVLYSESRIQTDQYKYAWGWEHADHDRPAPNHYLQGLLCGNAWDVSNIGSWPIPGVRGYDEIPDEPGQVRVRYMRHRLRYEDVLLLGQATQGGECEIDAEDGSGLDLRDLRNVGAHTHTHTCLYT